MSCTYLRAKKFPNITIIILTAVGTIFNVFTMTRCGSDSNPKPARQQALRVIFIQIPRVGLVQL